MVINTIVSSLNSIQRKKLDGIVFLHSDKLKGKTILGWLKEPVGSPSPDNFLKVRIYTNNQIIKIHQNKINQIYSLVQRYEPRAFREFNVNKRHALLSVFLLNLSKELPLSHFVVHTGSQKVGSNRFELQDKKEFVSLDNLLTRDQVLDYLCNYFIIDDNTILITNSDISHGYKPYIFNEIAKALKVKRHEHFWNEYHVNQKSKTF